MTRKSTIITYQGDSPTVLPDADLQAVLALFKQQNEIIEALATRILLVPEGTKLRATETP